MKSNYFLVAMILYTMIVSY